MNLAFSSCKSHKQTMQSFFLLLFEWCIPWLTPASHVEVVVEVIKTEVGNWSWNMTLMLWPSLVFRATYISDINSAKRKEIKQRKMPQKNGVIKNHAADFSVETSEGVKPRRSDTGWRTCPHRSREIRQPPTAYSQRSSVFHRPVRGAELGLCTFLQTCLKSSCWGRNILLPGEQWVRRNLSFRGISSTILHDFGLSLIKWWKRWSFLPHCS